MRYLLPRSFFLCLRLLYASTLHVHSVNYAAGLVHTRRALFNTNTNSHQEPDSGQACILLVLIGFSFLYPVSKRLLSLNVVS
jgi:hypothetical protein